jgi:hypothetical protein
MDGRRLESPGTEIENFIIHGNKWFPVGYPQAQWTVVTGNLAIENQNHFL